MTIEIVKSKGEYLGHCPQKGDIYSVPSGHDQKGNQKYAIVSLIMGGINTLLVYSATH